MIAVAISSSASSRVEEYANWLKERQSQLGSDKILIRYIGTQGGPEMQLAKQLHTLTNASGRVIQIIRGINDEATNLEISASAHFLRGDNIILVTVAPPHAIARITELSKLESSEWTKI